MKKTDLIKLLKAMEDNARACSKSVEDEKFATQLHSEAMAYNTVITLLTNKAFASDIANIYFN